MLNLTDSKKWNSIEKKLINNYQVIIIYIKRESVWILKRWKKLNIYNNHIVSD